jgi:hypothetical protein
MTKNEAFIWASGQYLTDHVTEEMLDDEGDMLYLFVTDHLWEPFEHYSTDSVITLIADLASSVETLVNKG